MTIEFGSIKSYNPDRGFGFVSRTFSNSDRKVFFHINKIKKKYPELAQKLDIEKSFETVSFWYKVETTEKGEQVDKLYLNIANIPQNYKQELCDLIQKIESIWRNVDSPKPSWLDFITVELVGVDRKHELLVERDSLESQLRVAEEKRRKELESERLRQIEAQREIERREAEQLRNRLESQRQEQIKIAQEKVRRTVEEQHLDRKDEIRQMCEEIGIINLVHFTHIKNLKNILKEGLLGRKQLENMNVEIHYNDQMRLDGKREAICLSISFPNYKMFYKYRCNNQPDTNWVVLLLKSSILWEMECRFYAENAASSNARHSELNGNRSQFSAFKDMFQDYGAIQRTTLRIPNNFTTHPQAEVMILNPIPIKYIESVDFYNKHTAEYWLEQNNMQYLRCINFYYSDRFFRPRQDWEFWKSQSPQNNMCIVDDTPF